jgi:hypothetical protein
MLGASQRLINPLASPFKHTGRPAVFSVSKRVVVAGER